MNSVCQTQATLIPSYFIDSRLLPHAKLQPWLNHVEQNTAFWSTNVTLNAFKVRLPRKQAATYVALVMKESKFWILIRLVLRLLGHNKGSLKINGSETRTALKVNTHHGKFVRTGGLKKISPFCLSRCLIAKRNCILSYMALVFKYFIDMPTKFSLSLLQLTLRL